ncbi:MAG: methyltransferase domain-containing protein [Lysobacter sp.]|nr:methyltransferase domain-containing protein [Lysobacter sp.]
MKLQIGAGLDGPHSWLNVDASPTLRLQRLPVVGGLLQHISSPRFSPSVVYADVVRGLSLPGGSARIVYSSHVLEHLALADLVVALEEIHRVLAPGGVFRSVLPDLDCDVQRYLESDADDRASEFMRSTLLGLERRERGLRNALRSWLGNSRHLWMWDYRSMAHRLSQAGFAEIRLARYGDSSDPAFAEVEQIQRWEDAFGFECRKPI